MKKVCSLLFVIFISFANANSQITHTQLREVVIKNQQEIKELKFELSLQKERFENNKQNYQTLYDGLGNQISLSSLIFAVLAIVLSYFVTDYIKRKQEEIKEAAKDTREVVELLQKSFKSINETREYIDKHNQELYIKIKRDHILTYIDRIVKVPEDLENLLPILFAVDELLPEDFSKIKGIIDNTDNSDIHRNVIILLCQHFPLEIIKDLSLRDLLFSSIRGREISGMFKRDLLKLVEGLFSYLKNDDISSNENKKLINHIFYNIYSSNSKYFNLSKQEDLNCLRTLIDISGMNKDILVLSVLGDKNPEVDYVSWVDNLFVNSKKEPSI